MIVGMTIEDMERLARTNDMGLDAMAIRLRAARTVTGLSQKAMAGEIGIGATALNNAELGLSAPNAATMKYLFRAHRIDFNFVMNGNFAQLPGDVQDRLFPALEAATNEWDQRESSGRGQAKPTRARETS